MPPEGLREFHTSYAFSVFNSTYCRWRPSTENRRSQIKTERRACVHTRGAQSQMSQHRMEGFLVAPPLPHIPPAPPPPPQA